MRIPAYHAIHFRSFFAMQVDRCGNQKDAARALGISPQYVNDLLHGRREPSDTILTKLGLKRLIVLDKPEGERTGPDR